MIHNGTSTARTTLLVAAAIYPLSIIFLYKAFVIAIVSGLLIFAMQGGLKAWNFYRREPLIIASLILICYPVITTLWSIDSSETTARSLTMLATHLPLFILTVSFVVSRGGRHVENGFLILILAFSVVSLFLYLNFGAIRADSSIMKETTGAFSNIAAAACLYSLAFLIPTKRSSKYFLIFSFTTISAIAIIIISESRSALLLSFLFFMVTITFMPGQRRQRGIKVVSIFSTFIFGFAFLSYLLAGTELLTPVIERLLSSQLLGTGGFAEAVLDPDKEADDYKRTLMYAGGYDLIKNYWVFGAGFGVLKVSMESTFGVGAISHNWIITALGELGIIGIGTMLAITIMVFRENFKIIANLHRPLGFRILAFQLLIVYSSLLLQGLSRPLFMNPLFSVVLGLACGILILNRNSNFNNR